MQIDSQRLHRLLSLPLFTPLSNLGYSCYLFHEIVVTVWFSQGPFPLHWAGHAPQMFVALVHIALSYVAAVVMFGTMEAPWANIQHAMKR